MSRGRVPRMRKVNEMLREVIADEIVELKDPRIGFVTITGVETAPDLRHAMVYYSVLGADEDREKTGIALDRSRSRIQRAVASQSRLKYTPVLEFRLDRSIDEGIHIDQLLREIQADDQGEA